MVFFWTKLVVLCFGKILFHVFKSLFILIVYYIMSLVDKLRVVYRLRDGFARMGLRRHIILLKLGFVFPRFSAVLISESTTLGEVAGKRETWAARFLGATLARS